MKNKDFWIFLITMVIGGLTYSVLSFAYMHKTFSTFEAVKKIEKRIDRIDERIHSRLIEIEHKIDRLIERGNR